MILFSSKVATKNRIITTLNAFFLVFLSEEKSKLGTAISIELIQKLNSTAIAIGITTRQ